MGIARQIELLKEEYESIVLTLSLCLIIGVFYSRAVTTICMGLIFTYALCFISRDKIMSIGRDKTFLPFICVWLAVVISGPYTDHQELWLTSLRVKLPFVILPFAFYFLPSFSTYLIVRFHYWLLGITVLVGIPVAIHALLHNDAMLDLIKRGQAIPTPIEHVKYSMFNAYAAISGLFLLMADKLRRRSDKVLLATGTFLMIFLLHLLAVRTGLMIFYLSIVAYCIYHFIVKGDRGIVVLGLAICLTSAYISIQLSPTLQKKISYMTHDWSQYSKDQGHQYSDSERMMSYGAALHLIKKQPLVGVGFGDVRDEAHRYYTQVHGIAELYKLPHSQYLLTLAGSGIVGFVIFIVGFYMPLSQMRLTTLPGILLILLYLNYSLSFVVENSLERSLSVAFFLTTALLILKTSDHQSTERAHPLPR